MLLTCQPLAANPVVISGIGRVELGQDIVMTEDRDKKGEITYTFRVKDGTVWRGATLMPVNNMPLTGIGDMIKTDVLLNKIIEEKISKDPDVLSTEKAGLITLGGRECATTEVKLAIPGGGIIANMDITIIPGAGGFKMVCFMCADSDTQYWRPVMHKILASIP
jgi:hypothetical protein